MFHRVPFISPASVVTAAVILVLATLFASSFSSPGVALAEDNRNTVFDQDTLENNGDVGLPVSSPDPDVGYRFSATNHDLPEVSIYAVMPEVGEEGRSVTVTLKLSRPLRTDEKYCYPGRESDGNDGSICIEGGIIVWDTYNDHLKEDGARTSDELIKFVFRGIEVEKRLTVRIADDECITPERTVRIAINWAFRSDTYGYTIDDTQVTVPVNGNDESDDTDLWDDYDSETGQGKCKPVDDGATEEFIYNHAPLFDGQPPTFSVPENTAENQDIGDPVTATDSDVGDTLTYSLDTGDASSFAIDSTTGQIKTRQGVTYDHETKDTYHVAVFVRDSKNIYGDSDTVDDDSIDVTINVTDVNEQPVFDANAPTTLNIVENTIAGTDIGSRVTATDPDNTTANPTKDTLTYSLDTGDGASFEIDSSGQIKTKDPLDRETKPSYTVTVSVSDNKDATGASDSAVDGTHTVTITIDNEVEPPTFNEEPPQGQNSLARSVAENTSAGLPIGNPVSATSEDGATLTYSLDDQDGASFEIDSNGQIKTKDALNYEDTQNIYSVTVSVTDGKDVHGSAESPAVEDDSIDVTINVTDVNEKPVFDATLPVEYQIAENTVAATPIGAALNATDPDPADTLTYTLDSDSAATFEIDTSGQIRTKAALDHEATETYNVTVSVRDSRDDAGNPDTADDATIDVTITITDEDDPGRITMLSSQQPASGETLTATLDDDDGIKTDIDVTWVWDSSTDKVAWAVIDGATTNSYIPQQGDVDKYLRVTATYDDELGPGKDAREETDSAVLTMPTTNELPSFADDAPMTLSVQENTPEGENIGDPFTATDTDSGDTLTYALDDHDGASFEIDASGQIKTKAPLDRETKASYTVTVSVHDGKDPFGNANTAVDATIRVTITVTDMVIPAVPELPTVEATPGAAAGLTVSWTAVTATETMPVDGYDVQYRKKDATPPADWSSANVTVTGATATITGLEYSTTYEAEVRSKNSEGESDWSPTGEGNIPSSLSVSFSPGSQTVNEGSSATFTVTVDPAADRSLSIPISVTLGSAEASDYSVSGLTNGTLTFADTESSKTFTISTTKDSDRSDETVNLAFGQLPAAVGTGTESTAQLTINDTTPAPLGGGGGGGSGGGGTPRSLFVSFGQATDTVTEGNIATITVNVSPAADRTLSILVSASSSNAESDDYSVSGTPLTFASGDTTKTFTVSTISDSDMDDETVNLAFGKLPAAVVAGTPPTSQLTIEDTTTAQPTNAVPEFASDATTMLFVPENTPAGENIGDPFTATDDDDTTLTYSLDDQDGASFEVDASGQIKTKSALDYETKDTYAVTVSVHDGKGPLGNANTAVDATIDATINVGNLDIPDAPAEPTVTPTPGAAAGLTVSWTAVTATETMPVDGYDVQYRKKDATPPADWSSANVTVTGATATITGLEYSTTYEAEVRSKNSEGESDWSPTGEGNIPSSLSVSFSPGSQTVNEGSSATITVNVSPAADRALSILVSASSSNAESGDYSVSDTPLTFASGDSSKTFTVSTISDPDMDDETVNLAFGQLPVAVGTGTTSQQQNGSQSTTRLLDAPTHPTLCRNSPPTQQPRCSSPKTLRRERTSATHSQPRMTTTPP